MSQEPWNDEIYNSGEKSRKNKTENSNVANKIFTVLAVLFLVIIVGITVTAIYLSSDGSNTDSTKEFYNTSNSSATDQSAAPAQTTIASTTVSNATTEASTGAQEGETVTVQPGEGVASIAARTGVSIADLERLNPEKMTTGSWLAHPGDTVRIK